MNEDILNNFPSPDPRALENNEGLDFGPLNEYIDLIDASKIARREGEGYDVTPGYEYCNFKLPNDRYLHITMNSSTTISEGEEGVSVSFQSGPGMNMDSFVVFDPKTALQRIEEIVANNSSAESDPAEGVQEGALSSQELTQIAKKRALEIMEQGDLKGAIDSMLSDLSKDETRPAGQMTMSVMMAIDVKNDPELNKQKAEDFINGFVD